MDRHNLVSVAGLALCMLIAWSGATNHRRFNLRLMAWGLALQLIMGAFIFLVPASRRVFMGMNDWILKLLETAQAGQKFVFGSLADSKAVGFVLFTPAEPAESFQPAGPARG